MLPGFNRDRRHVIAGRHITGPSILIRYRHLINLIDTS